MGEESGTMIGIRKRSGFYRSSHSISFRSELFDPSVRFTGDPGKDAQKWETIPYNVADAKNSLVIYAGSLNFTPLPEEVKGVRLDESCKFIESVMTPEGLKGIKLDESGEIVLMPAGFMGKFIENVETKEGLKGKYVDKSGKTVLMPAGLKDAKLNELGETIIQRVGSQNINPAKEQLKLRMRGGYRKKYCEGDDAFSVPVGGSEQRHRYIWVFDPTVSGINHARIVIRGYPGMCDVALLYSSLHTNNRVRTSVRRKGSVFEFEKPKEEKYRLSDGDVIVIGLRHQTEIVYRFKDEGVATSVVI